MDRKDRGRERREDRRVAHMRLVSCAARPSAAQADALQAGAAHAGAAPAGAIETGRLGVAYTVDLSLTGARLRVQGPVTPGARLTLKVRLAGTVRRARATVLWSSRVEHGRRCEVGIRFDSLGLALAADLWELAEAEQALRRHFARNQLAEFMLGLAAEGRSGLLVVESFSSEPGSAYVAFRDGRVIGVRTAAGGRGESALGEVLALGHGHMAFLSHPLAALRAEGSLALTSEGLWRLRRSAELAACAHGREGSSLERRAKLSC